MKTVLRGHRASLPQCLAMAKRAVKQLRHMASQQKSKRGLTSCRRTTSEPSRRVLSGTDFQKGLYRYGVGQPVKFIILRNGSEYLMPDYVIEERPQWAKPK
jgi:hypothetical protein